jgi:hypothetical protein
MAKPMAISMAAWTAMARSRWTSRLLSQSIRRSRSGVDVVVRGGDFDRKMSIANGAQ